MKNGKIQYVSCLKDTFYCDRGLSARFWAILMDLKICKYWKDIQKESFKKRHGLISMSLVYKSDGWWWLMIIGRGNKYYIESRNLFLFVQRKVFFGSFYEMDLMGVVDLQAKWKYVMVNGKIFYKSSDFFNLILKMIVKVWKIISN